VPIFRLPKQTTAKVLAVQIVLGLALAGIGILLLGFAFSGISLGRPITRAWVVGVLGLVLFIPGAVVACEGIVSAFMGNRGPRKGHNPPAQPRSC
jgi:ABC-type transport system involved in multi-copper enzyme maturation permease subunit